MRGFFYIQTEIKAAISNGQDEKFIRLWRESWSDNKKSPFIGAFFVSGRDEKFIPSLSRGILVAQP
jgi:hypothetical protein